MAEIRSPEEIACRYLRERTHIRPRVSLVLGSGLGTIADSFSDPVIVETSQIPGYPRGTIPGHRGRLVFAWHQGVPLVAFQGRVHFYECNDISSVLFPVRVAHLLGAMTILVTNAAGGVNRRYRAGDLMLITDQINLTGEKIPWNPNHVYRASPLFSRELTSLIAETAESLGVNLWQGVYAGVKGPSYETAAEVEMIHRLGGDAVGMSTILETALAGALGMRVAGISCITNRATGTGSGPLSHEEVTLAADHAREDFSRLVHAVIGKL
jgi:purine-nucleoside phosphorylase